MSTQQNINKPYPVFQLALRYIVYYLHARHRKGFGLHSPFAYTFQTRVVEDKTLYPEYKYLEGVLYDFFFKSNMNKKFKLSAVQKKYARLLFRLVKYFDCKNIVELGTGTGTSAAYMAMANPNATVYSIESEPQRVAFAQAIFDKNKIRNINIQEGLFADKLRKTLSGLSAIDLVFIDGDHNYPATVEYYKTCLEYAQADTIFVFHDIHYSRGMELSWKEIVANMQSIVTFDFFGMGIVFRKTGLQKQDYIIRF